MKRKISINLEKYIRPSTSKAEAIEVLVKQQIINKSYEGRAIDNPWARVLKE